jgi:drug/metabolite transporter (DMT)-like permease
VSERPGWGTRRDLLALVLVNVLWGSTYAVGRGLIDTTPPLVLAFVRFALASAWMLASGMHRPQPSPTARAPHQTPESRAARRKDGWLLLNMGLLGFGLSKLLAYEGLARSTATDAALIINLEAVFTALLAGALLGHALSRGQWGGLALAFGGGALLIWPSDPRAADPGARLLGNVLLVASVAGEALASILGARLMRRMSGPQITARATYLGTAALALPALWQWRQAGFTLAWLTPLNVAGLLYLSLAATVLAYALWFRLVARVDAGLVSSSLYVQPVVGVLLGILLRREIPTWLQALGAALVFTGIALASRPAGATPPKPTPEHCPPEPPGD